MQDFLFFVEKGLWHIADLGAYDHMLFITGLCIAYPLSRWKNLLWLVTAFTFGHSVALALSVLDVVRVDQALVEFGIPLSILATALLNLKNPGQQKANYALVLAFGLIHGLGFSNYLRFILSENQSLGTSLLGFNVGLELGQLLILATIFGLTALARRFQNFNHRDYVLFVSGAVAGISLILSVEMGYAYFWGGSELG